jgi:hypothetical protein
MSLDQLVLVEVGRLKLELNGVGIRPQPDGVESGDPDPNILGSVQRRHRYDGLRQLEML